MKLEPFLLQPEIKDMVQKDGDRGFYLLDRDIVYKCFSVPAKLAKKKPCTWAKIVGSYTGSKELKGKLPEGSWVEYRTLVSPNE